MSGFAEYVADVCAERDGLHAEVLRLTADVELLRVERDEAVELLEQALGSLERERELRLEVDNSVAQLLDAIKEHRRLITERVPQKSGRAIDESLWWWVQ